MQRNKLITVYKQRYEPIKRAMKNICFRNGNNCNTIMFE